MESLTIVQRRLNYCNELIFEDAADIDDKRKWKRRKYSIFSISNIFFVIFIIAANCCVKTFSSITPIAYTKFPTKLFEACPTELKYLHSYRHFPSTCRTQPPLAIVAYEGVKDAMKLCREEMRFKPWDCKRPAATILHEPSAVEYGNRESAYLWALSAAGAAWGVATACAQGWLEECKCANRRANGALYNRHIEFEADDDGSPLPRPVASRRRAALEERDLFSGATHENWEWGGCSYGVQYGVTTSRKLLTHTGKARSARQDDALPTISRKFLRSLGKHNLKTGRLAVKRTLVSSCKCHGVSGSCQQKTCWKKAADLRAVARHLTEKYERAQRVHRTTQLAQTRSTELVFAEESPDECAQMRYEVQSDANRKLARKRSLTPRVCSWRNETHSEGDCSNLCCGQEYTVSHEVISYKCDCKFVWCCKLECSECLQHRWISTCNV